MRLSHIAETGSAIAFADIGGFKDLVIELQNLLGELGVLDPPADAAFGPVSRWALSATIERLALGPTSVIDKRVAKALLSAKPGTLFPLKPKSDFAGDIVKYMVSKNYWVARHPDCLNIVYVEGANPDGTLNGNPPNHFNDARVVFRVLTDGTPEIVASWEATSEPGRFYTNSPLNPAGAARIALS